MERVSAKLLFNELKLKGLKKMGKKELLDTVGINLYPMVSWYFNDSFRGENRKFEPAILDLLYAKKLFLKPITKIINDKKRRDDVPEGLAVMLYDYLEKMYSRMEEKLQSNQADYAPSDETKEAYKNAMDEWKELRVMVEDITKVSAKKTIKKLIKLGMKEEYAIIIAPHIVPKEFLNKHNVRKYLFRLNQALYKVQKLSIETNKDDEFIVKTGVNLAQSDLKVIASIYQLALDGADRDTVINGLVGVALEKKSRALDTFTAPQLALYNKISQFVLAVLEGEIIFAPNIKWDKLSKKELKKAKKEYAFDKKAFKQFFNSYRIERTKDAKRNRDGARRIQFDSLNPEEYEMTVKYYNKYLKEQSKAYLQSTDAEKAAVESSIATEETKEKKAPKKASKK